MADDYYVYMYFSPRGTPLYVGKGRGERWLSHGKASHNAALKSIMRRSAKPLERVKIRQHLSETEAFATEIALIEAIGRRINGTGPLVNIMPGGPGNPVVCTQLLKLPHPCKGRVMSEETKRKIGDANRGKKRSAEVCAAMRERAPHPNTIAAVKLANTGRKHSAETRAKVAAAGVGKKRGPMPEAQRKWLSDTRKGKPNPTQVEAMRLANMGRARSLEIRVKISAAHKGKKLSVEHIAKMVANHKGTAGKKYSIESRQRMSAAQKKRRIEEKTLTL